MSEEKLKILEIIEPYTDKTLSEGCLVKIDWINEIIIYDKSLWGYTADEILWHYDITAVLKCVYKKIMEHKKKCNI